MVPLFTVLIYRVWFSRTYATGTYLSLIPIVVGAGMCTVGDYRASVIGLLVSLLGVILAAVKVRSVQSLHNLPESFAAIALVVGARGPKNGFPVLTER